MRARKQASNPQPRISLTLQVPVELNTELNETARRLDLTRHAFILCLVRQGLSRITGQATSDAGHLGNSPTQAG